MNNEEKKYKLSISNGAYCHLESHFETPTIGKEKWENAHHHKGFNEVYVVESGWIAVATRDGDAFTARIYHAGDVFNQKPGTDHNVFKESGSVIHVLKYGKPIGNPEKEGNDWFPSNEKFDSWSKGLTIKDIEEITGESL